MDNELANFDLDLEVALGERDGVVPSAVERDLTPLPLTTFDRDTLRDALDLLTDDLGNDDPEESVRVERLVDRLRSLTVQ